jgi:hypothetical protein
MEGAVVAIGVAVVVTLALGIAAIGLEDLKRWLRKRRFSR